MSDTPWTDGRILVVTHNGHTYPVVHADLVRAVELLHPEAFTAPAAVIEAPRHDVLRVGGAA